MGETVNFSRKNDPLTLLKKTFKKIKKLSDGKITIERVKELQVDLNNNIKDTKRK